MKKLINLVLIAVAFQQLGANTINIPKKCDELENLNLQINDTLKINNAKYKLINIEVIEDQKNYKLLSSVNKEMWLFADDNGNCKLSDTLDRTEKEPIGNEDDVNSDVD